MSGTSRSSSGEVSLFRENTYTLYARFGSVEGLRVGSPVEVFGIEVGKVTNLGIDNQRQAALVSMAIRRNVRTYRDAEASIKTTGLIGDKYLKIDPGGAEAPLKSGETITNTVTSPDIQDLIGQYIFGQVKTTFGRSNGGEKIEKNTSDDACADLSLSSGCPCLSSRTPRRRCRRTWTMSSRCCASRR